MISSSSQKIPVILFGDHIAAYGVVRALGPYKIPIYVVSAKGNGITTKSRYVEETLALPAKNSDFCERLCKWGLSKVGNDAVLIVAGSDDYLDVLSQNFDRLPVGWRTTYPSWDIVKKVRQKHITLKIAESIDLPVPKSVHVKTDFEFNEFVSSDIDMRWPLLLKPERSSDFFKEHKKKGVICENLSELKNNYSKYGSFPGGFDIQEFILGPESNLINFIGIYNKNSEPVAVFFNRKVRTSGPLLSCSLMETDWSEIAIEYSNKLIKKIGYYGYANVEFKIDPRDGSINLMEINGRVSMSNSHSLLCGINLPLSMYEEAIGHCNISQKNFHCHYNKRMLWWCPTAEIRTILKLFIPGEMTWRNYLGSFKCNKITIEPYNLQDPMPGTSAVFSLVRGGIRKFISLLLKSKEKGFST
jgi:D-aspartate ligase